MEPPNPWPDSGEQHGRMFKENNLLIDLLARVTEEFYCGSNRESWANSLRACLHGGEGPQIGEVTRLGGVTRLSI